MSSVEIIEPGKPKPRPFVHLHLHTTYSLLDGAQRIGDVTNPKKEYGLLNRVKELGMDAVAMTDHGNMFGGVDFYQKARKADIKPILGCEVYVAPGNRGDKEARSRDGKRAFHFTLLAQNYTGYRNLCKMITRGYFEGFYYNPRIDKELMREYSEGVIAMSACLASEVSQHCIHGRHDEAYAVARELQQIYDGRFFIELMKHGIKEQNEINPYLVEIAKDLEIPLVATNDVHYMTKEDAEAQDVLMAIQMKKNVSDPNRLKHDVTEFYLKTPEEMYAEFAEYPEACANTARVADMCNVELPIGQHFFPVIAAPDETIDNETFLAIQSREGLDKRWELVKDKTPPDKLDALRKSYDERLEYELGIIKQMGFSDYFLIVADFINWAKDNDIPVGPGRGCLTGDTPVMMADGSSKALQDIQIGDFVFSHTGTPRLVTDTMAYDVEETLTKLTTYYGDSAGITMTHDHKVFAEKAVLTEHPEKGKNKYQPPLGEVSEIPAEELEPGDWIYTPKLHAKVSIQTGHEVSLTRDTTADQYETALQGDLLFEATPANDSFVGSVRDIQRQTGVSRGFVSKYLLGMDLAHLTKRQKEAQEKVEHYLASLGNTPEEWREAYQSNREDATSGTLRFDHTLMWVLGRWVADGWFNSTKQRHVGFCFRTNERAERQKLEQWLCDNQISYATYFHTSQQRVQLSVTTESFCRWMGEQFPEYEHHASSKSLPAFFHKLSDDLLAALLRGYISSGGLVCNGRIKMPTTSVRLARQLKYALNRLNVPSSIRQDLRRGEHVSYIVSSPALTPLVEHDESAQSHFRYRRFSHGMMCQIKSVEEVTGIDKVYDITVEEDHSYMTYSGAVHNSAAGSLVAYCIRITDVDPMAHDLLFERFLNPERISMPDVDVDFCEARREEVIEYVRQRYAVEGGYAVSQIITFGTLKAKAAVKDVARAYGMTFGDANQIAKLIPDVLGIKLREAIEQEPRLAHLIKSDSSVAKVMDISQRLEGLNRHASIHAAGVVISDGRPLDNHLPLYKGANGEVVTQYDMSGVESIGLIKFDFLGLKNLTLMTDCLRLIKENFGRDIDLARIPFDDPETFKLLCRGDTLGVFQLESSGMREVMMKLKPSVFDDVIALVALYRPGPLQGGVVDSFIDRKHGREEIKYHFDVLEPILNTTYGVCIYQEQVMQIANVVANYSLGEADKLRRAMGKKKEDEMARQRIRFLDGAKENNFDLKKAEDLYDTLAQFAKYGFNKSHSAAYGLIAYQTAWLKANYRHEYMAALLTADAGRSDKVLLYLNDCRNSGIEVLPPHVNESQRSFSVVNEKIRFGMAAVKGLGDAPIFGVIEERKENGTFDDFMSFCERVDFKGKKINRRVMEALIKCGAFDGLGVNRASMFEGLEKAMAHGQKLREEKESAQFSLFGGGMMEAAPAYTIPELPEWGEKDKLSHEKGVLGLYISGHPLDRYAADLEHFISSTISELGDKKAGSSVSIAGIVTSRRDMTTKKGDRMAFIVLEDLTGEVEVSLFPKTFVNAAPFLDEDDPLLIKGESEKTDTGSVRFTAKEVASLAAIRAERAKEVHLDLSVSSLSERCVEEMTNIFKEHQGSCVAYLHVRLSGRSECVLKLPDDLSLAPSEDLVESLERLFGKNPTYFK